MEGFNLGGNCSLTELSFVTITSLTYCDVLTFSPPCGVERYFSLPNHVPSHVHRTHLSVDGLLG